ncbi:hypothetical protein HNR19_004180 [Nocardioides thalensis]|uniref:Uncharacterized protein n=1 Tax=Nocardioides thalensis TaxID=1914755 RepID=A0A853CA04_9ACTN|nr:hypothetical protein [Nocardioides thalensis]NYJ03482.1 hypothetical protein [Nocardioides thalensis]
MFNKLKQIGQALSPDAIRQGLAASRESLASGGQLSAEQLAAMTPEQRAQYEQAMADSRATVAANADAAIEREMERRVLFGPAGDWLYGPLPDRERMTDMNLQHQLAYSKAELKATLRNPLGRKPAPVAPPPVSADPGEQAAHELAQREEARTPYLSPERQPITFTRIATEPRSSVEQLCAWLGSSGLAGRPDLVYGVARVPDHLPGGLGIRKTAVVEWEVVHAAQTALPAVAPAVAAAFDARDTWAARRPGEPSIVDEDLGLEYLRFADLGPEQCLGLARQVAVDASGGGGGAEGGGSSPYVLIGVTGLLALHPAGTGAGAHERMTAARLLQVVPDPEAQVVVLNWGEVRKAVAPRPDKRPPVPSPFPYLPSTAGELLHSYLSIVGVRPQDCYSAQVTQDRPDNFVGGTGHVTTTGAESDVAADGQLRRRFRGGSRVVVVYRDSPAYAEGRQRWAAYERDVLQARLGNRTGLRSPVDKESRLDKGALGKLLRGVEAVGSFVEGEWDEKTLFDDVPYYRYCWPPVGG